MSEQRHFSLEEAEILKRVFARLSVFMYQNRIKQIVGVGPSASPYVRAVARLHCIRYGVKLKVVALGQLGEHVAKLSALGKVEDAARLLSTRRTLMATKTLLFDEVVHIGKDLLGVKSVLNYLKIPHQTATLLSDFRYSPYTNFVGVDGSVRAAGAFYLSRGKLFQDRANYYYDSSYLGKIRKELREIANSVPPKAKSRAKKVKRK